jgi:hypothetical protein
MNDYAANILVDQEERPQKAGKTADKYEFKIHEALPHMQGADGQEMLKLWIHKSQRRKGNDPV